MRKKNILILAFLVLLYIVPLIFMPTSYHVTIPVEQNTSKEFSRSGDYTDPSPQSIYTFSETLEDDVLHFPDGIINYSLAFQGSAVPSVHTGNYTDTHIKDGDWFEADWGSPIGIYLNFSIACATNELQLINLNSYALSNENASIDIYDGSSWRSLDNFTAGAWHNITIPKAYISSSVVMARYYFYDDEITGLLCMVDYAELVYEYTTLFSDSHYAESFADVSDWTQTTGETWGTDGDRMYIDVPNNVANDVYYTNSPSFTSGKGLYYELRFSKNITYVDTPIALTFYASDGATGNSFWSGNKQTTVTGVTVKGIITTDYAIESIKITLLVPVATGSGCRFYFDYLRISPADEMGWQHDGSTIQGISSADGGTITSSSGRVTLTAGASGSTFLIVADTTATASAISCTYYPFLSMSVTSGSGSWTLEQYDGSAYATLQSSTTITIGTKRFNMRSLDTYVSWWRITITASGSFVFDFMKAYSIANFTYTGTGVSTDDVLYISSSLLYCSGTSFTSIVLDRDNPLSVDTSIYEKWQFTATDNAQFDYYVSAWKGYSSEEEGTLFSGTLTDVRFKFTESASITSLEFLAYVEVWNSAGSVDLIFYVPIDETALNWLLILLGMCMIPASSLYLVKGGKDAISSNKFFYFCIAFVLGWALLLGGIYA